MSYPNCVVHVIHNQDLKEIYAAKLVYNENQIARRGTF